MGRSSKKHKVNNVQLYYVNINGYKSKELSLISILDTLEPNIVVLAETKVSKAKEFNLAKYEYVKRNCTKGQGGLICAVKKNTFKSICNVTTTESPNILVCRIEYSPNQVVRVVCVYGPQENEERDERESFYDSLAIEVEKTIHANEILLVVGDFNAKISHDGDNNAYPNSGNGGFLCELITRYNLHVMNFSDKCTGQWTWSRTINGVLHQSKLDYFLTDSQTQSNVANIEIDESKIMCPFYKKRTKGKEKIVYSDHNPLIAELLIPENVVIPDKINKWVITRKGLDVFTKKTEKNFNIDVSDYQTTYTSFEKTLKTVMQQCFKMKTVDRREEKPLCTNRQRRVIKMVRKFSTRGKLQRKIAETLMKRINNHIAETIAIKKAETVMNTVKSIEVDDTFSPKHFWKLKKVLCPKSRMEKAIVVLENNVEVHGEAAVKEAYRQEFKTRLQPNPIDPLYQEYERHTVKLLKLYIEWARTHPSDPDFTYEEVLKVIKSLSNRKTPGLDGIVNELLKAAGKSMIMALLEVLNAIKRDMKSPEQWDDLQISTIFKNVGSKRNLVNFRGIFLASCLSKLFEKLLKNRTENEMKNVSKRQAGATPGKCPADNTFLINACIDHAKYLNQSVTILFYDFKQCFDKLWLENCLISLWDVGIRNEWLPLTLELNNNAKVVCNTPYGPAAPFNVGRIVKQGTVLGSGLCGAQTAEYGADVVGFQIGDVNVKPPVFVDDIAVPVQGTHNIIDAHMKAVVFSKRKKINFGHSKCLCLTINKKDKDIIPLLQIDGHIMEKVSVAKYLGDMFNEQGNNVSMIMERKKKANGKTISTISMCEEGNLGKYLISTLLLLYTTNFRQNNYLQCRSMVSCDTGEHQEAESRTTEILSIPRIRNIAT